MDERQRRTAMVAGAVVLGLLSTVAGALIALSDDGDRAATTPSASPSPTSEPSPSETPSASPSPQPAEIEDGKHFVYVTDARRREDGSTTVTFDLAYFLTG